jgi:hypothetical protein
MKFPFQGKKVKRMMYDERRPQLPSQNDLERQGQQRMIQSGIEEQEIRGLKNTTAQRAFYIVVGVVLLLLLIVGILGANMFHFMSANWWESRASF